MKLSIVDISPVPPSGNAVDAMRNSVDLAQRAEKLGYFRYRVAGHHAHAAQTAGSNPEVLIARIAALTSTIRVGSGTVLLNHCSPFRATEMLRIIANGFQTDEIVVQDVISGHQDRLHSYELLASVSNQATTGQVLLGATAR